MKFISSLLVVVVVVIQVAHGSRLLGEDECTFGPSYWCQNYTAANTCGERKMVNYCSKEWETNSKKMDDPSGLCTECKTLIGDAQKAVNQSRGECKQSVENICTLIKEVSQQLGTQCDDIVNKNFDIIYDDIVASMDPGTICTGLGFCRNKHNLAIWNTGLKEKKARLLASNHADPFGAVIAPVPIFANMEDSVKPPKK